LAEFRKNPDGWVNDYVAYVKATQDATAALIAQNRAADAQKAADDSLRRTIASDVEQ
jgi:hypothetical protein